MQIWTLDGVAKLNRNICHRKVTPVTLFLNKFEHLWQSVTPYVTLIDSAVTPLCKCWDQLEQQSQVYKIWLERHLALIFLYSIKSVVMFVWKLVKLVLKSPRKMIPCWFPIENAICATKWCLATSSLFITKLAVELSLLCKIQFAKYANYIGEIRKTFCSISWRDMLTMSEMPWQGKIINNYQVLNFIMLATKKSSN